MAQAPRSSKLQATQPALGAWQPHAAPSPGARSRRRPQSSPFPAPPALTRAAACCSRPPPPRDSLPPSSPLQAPAPSTVKLLVGLSLGGAVEAQRSEAGAECRHAMADGQWQVVGVPTFHRAFLCISAYILPGYYL